VPENTSISAYPDPAVEVEIAAKQPDIEYKREPATDNKRVIPGNNSGTEIVQAVPENTSISAYPDPAVEVEIAQRIPDYTSSTQPDVEIAVKQPDIEYKREPAIDKREVITDKREAPKEKREAATPILDAYTNTETKRSDTRYDYYDTTKVDKKPTTEIKKSDHGFDYVYERVEEKKPKRVRPIVKADHNTGYAGANHLPAYCPSNPVSSK